MKLAFCLFKYHPFGGLGRDFLRIAQLCQKQGHTIDVYLIKSYGEMPAGFNVYEIPVFGISNHRRCKSFAKRVQKYLKNIKYDLVIGFNRMPGLDLYYAADICYQTSAKAEHGWLYRLTNRYRSYVALEKTVFSPEVKTKILAISPQEKDNYKKCYQTTDDRFYDIPPGITPDRYRPENAEAIRTKLRRELNIADDQFLLLMVGSNFKLKGVDRSLLALAALPTSLREKTHLFVLGEGKQAPYLRMAKRLKISSQFKFLGTRNDVLNFMIAADLLLHPSYKENTGNVLTEALAAGLPILVTQNCGYAFHIKQAQAGLVVDLPYRQDDMNRKLQQMLDSNELKNWGQHALAYVKKMNLQGLHETVVSIVEG